MLRLAACMVFQNPTDSKICFIKRKESELWGLPGGKLEDYESHCVQSFSIAGKYDKINLESGTILDPLSWIMQDQVTINGFLHAAIREGREEAGQVPVSQEFIVPFPYTVYSVYPLHCGSPESINSIGIQEKDFYTFTFYCNQFVPDSSVQEDSEIRWEDPEFLLSPQIFVPDYNKIVYEKIKGLKNAQSK